MNEYYAQLVITGNSDAIQNVKQELFSYHSLEQIDVVIRMEMDDPIRRNGVEYTMNMIDRYKDENGGYCYLNLEVWKHIVGTEANVDLETINARRLRVRIATRMEPDLDMLKALSARYAEVTFHYHQMRWHMVGELLCVIRYGRIEDCIRSDVEVNEDQDRVLTYRSWTINGAHSRLRMRFETLNECGEWELGPLRIVDESMIYPGCKHDTDATMPPVVYVY